MFNRILATTAFGVLIIFCASFAAAGDIVPGDVAHMIAQIDSGGISRNNVNVTRIRYLLSSVSKQTGNSETHIGDMLAYAQKKLRNEYGKEVKMQQLLEEANEVVQSSPGKTNFQTIITLLIMEHGM
jgi:hypothetical protein